jgi:hypothetical protein
MQKILVAVDGDDKLNFLPKGNDAMYHLLYYWHRLDEEGYLQRPILATILWLVVQLERNQS